MTYRGFTAFMSVVVSTLTWVVIIVLAVFVVLIALTLRLFRSMTTPRGKVEEREAVSADRELAH